MKLITCRRFPIEVPSPDNFTLMFLLTLKKALKGVDSIKMIQSNYKPILQRLLHANNSIGYKANVPQKLQEALILLAQVKTMKQES